MADSQNIYEIEYNRLQEEIPEVRKRLLNACSTLKKYFVDRDDVIDAMFTAASAGEPALLIGEPGTAKSDLVIKFAETSKAKENDYFEYMLTKFTEPNELLGPIDIDRLKAGEYFRRIEGKLPVARIVFLDEIFKSNSAILNTLLTVLNERKFYQNGMPVPVKMVVFFGATNEIPAFGELDALKDRFALKLPCQSVRADKFDELMESGLRNEIFRTFNEKPWQNLCETDDFLKIKAYIERTIAGLDGKTHDNSLKRDRELFFDDLYPQFVSLLDLLESEMRVRLSDRKVIKLYKLIRTHSFLFHGGEIRPSDLLLLRFTADTEKTNALIRERIQQRLI
ncbi:MAG: AAA family ATPase [Planctomycetes bacterium]|nr:AAA family ATPase [Planctomycetota bacterium]